MESISISKYFDGWIKLILHSMNMQFFSSKLFLTVFSVSDYEHFMYLSILLSNLLFQTYKSNNYSFSNVSRYLSRVREVVEISCVFFFNCICNVERNIWIRTWLFYSACISLTSLAKNYFGWYLSHMSRKTQLTVAHQSTNLHLPLKGY